MLNPTRCAVCTSFAALTLLVLAAWASPAAPQERGGGSVKPADGVYMGSDQNGSYQTALDAAIAKARGVLSNNGKVADLKFNWTVTSVSGTSGGITGKHDITVAVHVTM